MIGIGTIVNVIAIIVGSGVGLFFKDNLKDKYTEIMLSAIGLSVLVVGFAEAIKVLNTGDIDAIKMIIFLVIGSVIGVFLKISDRLNNFGELMQKKFSKGSSTFAEGFVTASLIYCVGAMAIIGSINDGLFNDPTTLYTKAILDATMSMILASKLGVGVMFSTIPVFIYQMSITFSASLVQDILNHPEIESLIFVIGNILIIGIGLDILNIKKIKVADMLPSVFIPIIYFMIKLLIWS